MGLVNGVRLPRAGTLLREALLAVDRVAPGTGVPVLCYHKICDAECVERHPLAVSVARFTAQMEQLAAMGYRTVSAAEALSEPPAGQKVVALTFDDGHADALETAAPVLARLGFGATVFPVIEWVGRDGWLDHRNGSRLGAPRVPEDLGTRFLTWDELKSLQSLGWSVGAHTMTHRPLLDLDAAARLREISAPKSVLEEQLGVAVELFAYPYRSYSAECAATVRRSGYRLAFSLEPGLNRPATDPMSVRRAPVRGWHDPRDFRLRLTGKYVLFRRVAARLERRAAGQSAEGADVIRAREGGP